MKHNRLAAGILALTLAFGMTACGEDSSADSTAATTGASTPASTEASAQGAMEATAATTEAAATEGATETATEAQADPKDAVLPTSYGDSYCKKFSERYSDEALTMDCSMRMSMLGTQLDYQIYTTYSKAKNAMYSEVTMSGGGETYSIIMYWDKDACYTLLPVEKMYSVKDEGLDLEEYMEESGMGQITGNAEDLTLDKAEFVTVKGKECVKETYQLDQSEAAYIFDLATGDLLSISTSMEGTEISSMEFTTLNGTCDENKLVMPDLTGYTKSDTDLAN
ncbi:hypothetical protein [Ruminococcus champanellensis]|uniref:hypothetical protein n=1 Tax=Ruminococcus champanellensis TaxID=1161942 RepID=UPI0023F02521|nr:hypothetical protein [Ruminococcus champanellensis]